MTRLFLFLVLFLMCTTTAPAQAQERGSIYKIHIQGVVTTVTTGYMERALRVAEASNATALIIELSSEGAVLRHIRPMAVKLAEATVPVIVYVAPEGTESGAAGAFFLSAAHIAAMAPDTSFGSPEPLAEVDQLLTEQTRQMVLDSVAEQLHEWNERQGRNTEWVDRATQEGVLLNNQQAFASNPPSVDIIAQSQDELFTLLEGRTVQLIDGKQIELQTLGRDTTQIPPTLWEQFLLMLANPTIAFLLLVMGCIALYAELVQPSIGIFAGISAIFLLGALVGLVVLPVRWISLSGLLLAFALIAADVFVPTHGGLTLTGLVLMIVSSLTLIDTAQAPNVFIALWAILLVAMAIASFAAVAIWLIVRVRNKPVSTGQEGLVGSMAEVRQRLEPEGLVFVDGALWRAFCEDGVVEKGEWVVVKEVHHLRLIVARSNVQNAGFSVSSRQTYTPQESSEQEAAG